MIMDWRKMRKDSIHVLQILFMLVMCVLYPFWWYNGYLDTTYLKIAVGVAAYGGFFGSLVWYIQHKKNN
jgi:hypothetical protein